MKKLLIVVFGTTILVALVFAGFRALDGTERAQADNEALIFRAELDGAQEVPPVVTDTTGRAQINVNKAQTKARFRLRVRGGIAVTQAHIHCAPAGQNGPIIAFLFGFVSGGVDVNGNLAKGTLTDTDIITSANCATSIGMAITDISDLTQATLNRNTYINVHTVANPTGEVRGQIAGDVIVVSTTIQDAVDAASPGDTIVVRPGTYNETVVVDKDDITIQGSHGAVLDATGFDNGILVGTGTISIVCPEISVHNFKIKGLTITNAEDTGIRLVGVDGFHITGGRYIDNEEYGPFPICSKNGLIDFNQVSGTKDAGIYVGDDDNVTVANNHVSNSAIGIEIENSTNAVVRNNKTVENTSGIVVVVLPGLPMPFTDGVLIENNVVHNNNLPNPVPAGSGDPVGLIPTGTGILNVGGDNVQIRDNIVNGNNSVGVAIIANPFAIFDPRIEPFPDGNEVRDNLILHNGNAPDPIRATTPGADIVYDGSGTGNCFANNIFNIEFPPGITASFPCP